MNNKIAGYIKTEHFMLRQWERKIEDQVLKKVLNRVNGKKGEYLLVVSREIMRSVGGKDKELFIMLRGKVLVTCFYGKRKKTKINKTKPSINNN